MKTATLLVAVTVFALASCASSPPPCDGPQTRNLSAAVDHVKGALGNGCAAHFDRFYDDLLRIVEPPVLQAAIENLGSPGDDNAAVQQALAALETARLNLERATVRAPGDGVVTGHGRIER